MDIIGTFIMTVCRHLSAHTLDEMPATIPFNRLRMPHKAQSMPEGTWMGGRGYASISPRTGDRGGTKPPENFCVSEGTA